MPKLFGCINLMVEGVCNIVYIFKFYLIMFPKCNSRDVVCSDISKEDYKMFPLSGKIKVLDLIRKINV